jgi:hypothetical protein
MSTEVSVIIPAYNASKTIGACIESLLVQETREGFEIIVVDDGSSDDTAEVAERYPKVRVLRQVNSGAGPARNLAARNAKGWILCLIDADCVATHHWLDALVATIRCGADGAKGVYRSSQPELVARFTQIEYEDRYDRMDPQRPINFVDTSSAAYRRDLFLQAGGFENGIHAVEDQELSFRLAKGGHDLRFVPEAAVYHLHRPTLVGYIRRKFDIGRWKVPVHVRHPERLVSDSHTPPSLRAQVAIVGGLALSLVFTPLRPSLLRIWPPLMAVFMATAVPFIIKAARKDPLVALISPAMLLVRAGSLAAGVGYGTLSLARTLIFETEQDLELVEH